MSEIIEIANPSVLPGTDDPSINSIPRVKPTISYNEFFSEYLVKNRPCIIDSESTGNWPCRRKWVVDNAPNFEYLRELFGHCTVPVADCNKKYYNSQLKNDMSMNDYLDYWKRRITDKNLEPRLLYLKDWHCVRAFPNLPIYKVPKYFASDWLNEYYLSRPELNDDYMFIYMGPKGTWTPLHVDVFTSYSWSANVVGRKRWLLFPPGQESRFRDVHGQLAYDATADELNDPSRYEANRHGDVRCLDVIQEAGEIVFVPSGWHHQVWNLEDTISINHNWINGCNVGQAWSSLRREYESVVREIADCREMENWPEQCQLILKTSYGVDYPEFLDFLAFVARRRLDATTRESSAVDYRPGANHRVFDLRRIGAIVEDLMRHAMENSIDTLLCKKDEANVLLNDIHTNVRSS